MLKSIQSMRGVGIFDDYVRPAGMKEFSDRNVIYGWNYSGKTTLSRLMHSLNERAINDTFGECKFKILDSTGGAVDEGSLAQCAYKIRVFNSDFVDTSLNWNGRAFKPILLLGAEAQDAQKKVTHYENVMRRCSTSAHAYRQKIADIDRRVADAKTAAAKQIKTTLGLVEAFTATHLNGLLNAVSAEDALSQEQITSDLSLATTSEKERLPPVSEIAFRSSLESLSSSLAIELNATPASSSVIEFLRQNPAVADWVSAGLALHEGQADCLFCLSRLSDSRLSEIRAHFSREVTDQRARLEALSTSLERARFVAPDVREGDLSPQFRERLQPLLNAILERAALHNRWIDEALKATTQKLKEQFSALPAPSNPKAVVDDLARSIAELNRLIAENNAIGENFSSVKSAALKRLKSHFAQQFFLDNGLAVAESEKEALELQARRFDAASAAANAKLQEEQARINRAQNGREKINERIAQLLNSSAIRIEVRHEEGADKFVLMRGTRIAKNLSEGEKTAIAFAFFLTKLLEDGDLADVVVYIDDPISSLDSNHIFQVFSILKATFFKFDKPKNEKGKWKTTCKQLFVSTHNFEFFQLLHDLPGDISYFLTKRISPSRATFQDLPLSVARYTSEYHYLFHILYSYHTSTDKANEEHLLALPNAARRFVELYTYAKLPLGRKVGVEERAARLFGAEPASRILKVLHHFSHLESIERLMANTNLVADIDGAVTTLMQHLETDKDHYEALVEAVTRAH